MTGRHDAPPPAAKTHGSMVTTRRWALVAFAGAAAAVGAAVATRHFSLRGPQAGDLWSQSFPAIDGKPIRLADFKGRPLIINFWATWCPPCVKEMPLIDGFYQQIGKSKLNILGLAVDQPEAVKRFLQRTPVHYTIAMAGADGVDLTRKLGNNAGALPFSVFFDADGAIRHRKLGELSAADLSRWMA